MNSPRRSLYAHPVPSVNEFGQQVGEIVEDWAPRAWPEPVTLEGRYVDVVPLTSARFAELFATTCGEGDDDLWTYRPIDRPTALQHLWMHLAAHLDAPDMVTFAFIPKEGPAQGKAAGIASYMRIDVQTGQVEVAGVLFSKQLRRTRAATESIHLLIRHALDELGYRRFEWKCDSLNEPSRRAAKRFGFTYEGRFRHHMITKGRNRDTDWFSITDAEWPAIRAEHERWLDPANFDAEGGQRTPLGAPWRDEPREAERR